MFLYSISPFYPALSPATQILRTRKKTDQFPSQARHVHNHMSDQQTTLIGQLHWGDAKRCVSPLSTIKRQNIRFIVYHAQSRTLWFESPKRKLEELMRRYVSKTYITK